MKKTIRYAGIMFSFFITANFYVITIVAMLNDNAVTVYYNHFGEALIEYIIYIALIPILLYSFYYEITKFRRSKKYAKKKYTKNYKKNISRIKEE